jgi:hypothetical protein
LTDVLRESMAEKHPQVRLDWAWLAQPENHLGQADALIERALTRIAEAREPLAR